MPLSEVSNAIAQFLDPSVSGIDNYGVIYQALPKIANEADIFTNTYPGAGVGATLYMFFIDQKETRIALGGAHNGRKFRTYTLAINIIFKSDLDDTVSGQLLYNTFIDQLTARIQSDRTAGTAPSLQYGGVVFQWGEGGGPTAGGPDIELTHYVPRTQHGGVTIFQSLLHVSVCEIMDT